jgi:glycosyltransferase involved in cell wall biosynthesis
VSIKNISHQKQGLIIYGAYPKKKIYGGFVTDCNELSKSAIYKNYNVIQFDGCQISNPIPKLHIRLWRGLFRAANFFSVVRSNNNIKIAIIFLPSGLGALEKILLAIILIKMGMIQQVLFFPRAGALSSQLPHYPNFVKRMLNLENFHWYVQGPAMSNCLHKLGVMSTSIVYPFLAPGELKLPNGLNKRKKYVTLLFVGWLEKSKGILDLIESVLSIRDDLRLVIVGNGSLFSEIEILTKNDQRIKLEGWRDHSCLREYYMNSDCLILPSYTEGLPNVIAEAMIHQLCVISSRVGEISNILEDEVLIEPGNINELTNLILKCCRDKVWMERIAIRNREFSITHFGVDKLDEILQLNPYLEKYK